jgi:hypothetical protein
VAEGVPVPAPARYKPGDHGSDCPMVAPKMLRRDGSELWASRICGPATRSMFAKATTEPS